MNKTCPCCNRHIAINTLATNINGEPIMEWHFDDQERECLGSHKSITDALVIIQEQDRLANGTGSYL